MNKELEHNNTQNPHPHIYGENEMCTQLQTLKSKQMTKHYTLYTASSNVTLSTLHTVNHTKPTSNFPELTTNNHNVKFD